jgi:TfoX/Sxy family transcriptional regulator of competence genes
MAKKAKRTIATAGKAAAKTTTTRVMPKWMPAPPELAARFQEAASSLNAAEIRKMFGYPAAFLAGHMFAGVFQDCVIVRLRSEDRAALLERPGARVFEPMPGRPMREYVVVPTAVRDSMGQLEPWLAKAAGYVRTLPPKTPKAGRSKRRRG